MPAFRRLVVIHNPAAGQRRRRKTEKTLALLRAAGCSLDLRATAGPGDAEAIAASVTALECDALVVAGGDGTVNEVVNGMLRGGGPAPPLAVIPLGTANVLAAEIGLATTPAAVAGSIMHGTARRIHLGTANGRYFVLMAGVGLDAHVVAHVSLALKRRVGKLAYVAETLAQALRYGYPACRVVVDGVTYKARTVVACNGRLYGGPFLAAPLARLDRPGLEVVLLAGGGLWNTLRYGAALVAGRLSRLNDVQVLSCRSLRIEGEAGAPVQVDGDAITQLPVDIAVADACIDLIYPPGR